MISPAHQLAVDVKSLMKRFDFQKKDLAAIMADSLGRDSEHFYTYFCRHSTGVNFNRKFYDNFYKIFHNDLSVKALLESDDIAHDEQMTEQEVTPPDATINAADSRKIQRLMNQYKKMNKKLQFLVKVNKKVLLMQAEILARFKEKA